MQCLDEQFYSCFSKLTVKYVREQKLRLSISTYYLMWGLCMFHFQTRFCKHFIDWLFTLVGITCRILDLWKFQGLSLWTNRQMSGISPVEKNWHILQLSNAMIDTTCVLNVYVSHTHARVCAYLWVRLCNSMPVNFAVRVLSLYFFLLYESDLSVSYTVNLSTFT